MTIFIDVNAIVNISMGFVHSLLLSNDLNIVAGI